MNFNSQSTEHEVLSMPSDSRTNDSNETAKTIGLEVVSATDLVAAKAEIWVLRQHLNEARIARENLCDLVNTTITKQNELLAEVYNVREQNAKLESMNRMQRGYHAMERSSLMTELFEMKALLGEKATLLEKSEEKNAELIQALRDANDKVFTMGMQFLKLKSSRSQSRDDISASQTITES